MEEKLKGLSNQEVKKRSSLGLSNQIIDSYTPSTLTILRRNLFSLINLILIPLLATLFIYEQYREVLAFSTFLIINTAISMFDELRAKRQLQMLKQKFQLKATVVRNGEEKVISISEIVQGDIIKASESDGIIADGVVITENYLQLDESALNGESNYIRKEKGEQILSGSFVVTGNCYYEVESVGKGNYLNKVGEEALKYHVKRSQLQSDGDKLILFLVIASIILSVVNFYVTGLSGFSTTDRLLSVTTIITLIIPQTLIFLFTLTFTVSIIKLYNKGVVVQKGGSIEELAKIDTICFDKTGTITTNDMKVLDVTYFNIEEEEIGSVYNSVKDEIVGVNKTQEIIHQYYEKYKRHRYTDFDQVPFTSKNKFSLVKAKFDDKEKILMFGAFSLLKNNVEENIREKIEQAVLVEENKGNRILVGLYYANADGVEKVTPDLHSPQKTDKVVIFTIEETLNPGIKDIFTELQKQEIAIKIISGDSLRSVKRILEKIGLDIKPEEIIDLSVQKEFLRDFSKYKVFTRAKPEDKLIIVKELQREGHQIAMVGDGINDVLSMKASDVSISMESGSKIAREVSDMVLLGNDYKKIPEIFYEGDNIIFNLKTTTKIFLVKSFLAIFIASFFSLLKNKLPMDPASVLIFSFLGSSAPSYALVFTRQKIAQGVSFFREVLISTVPISFIFFSCVLAMYYLLTLNNNSYLQTNSTLIMLILSLSTVYTLFLIWDSKKVRNAFILGFIYLVLMFMGTFQMLLPLFQNGRTQKEVIIMIALMFIGSIIVFAVTNAIFKPKNLFVKLLLAFVSVAYIPIVSIFPFQTYYNVIPVPLPQYYVILFFTLICALGIVGVHFVAKKNFLKEKI